MGSKKKKKKKTVRMSEGVRRERKKTESKREIRKNRRDRREAVGSIVSGVNLSIDLMGL